MLVMSPPCQPQMHHDYAIRSRTPPEIKWLLNERAAVAGTLQRSIERQQSLQHRLKKLQHSLVLCAKALTAAEETQVGSQRTLVALDAAINLVNKRINPTAAGVVNASQGKYGECGGLRKYVSAVLEATYPAPVTMLDLMQSVVTQFGVKAVAPADRKALRSSIRCALQWLLQQGRVEPLHAKVSHRTGIWRWKEHSLPSFEQMAQAQQELLCCDPHPS